MADKIPTSQSQKPASAQPPQAKGFQAQEVKEQGKKQAQIQVQGMGQAQPQKDAAEMAEMGGAGGGQQKK